LQGSLTFPSYPLLEEDVLVQEHNLAYAMAWKKIIRRWHGLVYG
jgi:hypothetical protein